MHNDRKWWKESVIYQLYPRSFQDSNGDGIGDLRGILQRMDYLEQLGIRAIWLNPIYKSPNDDMGYDIRAHARGIRIIMDLVVNHTSDEHAWFVEARKSKDNPYRDFYIWRKGKGKEPGDEPNNWASFFTPSAWTYDEATDEYYLHLFSQKQPDLNWENPRLREEVYRMMNWWMDKGIDGFRMDVINLIAKEEGLPDGASSGAGYVFCPEHFANQEKLHDHLQEMRRRCFDGRDAMCVGETPFSSPETGSRLMDPENRELDMIFQDALMEVDSGEGSKWNVIPFSLKEWKRRVRTWQQVAENTWGSLFWSNHDQPRPLSRFVDLDAAARAAIADLPEGAQGQDAAYAAAFETLRTRAAKMLGAAMHLMRGTSYIFQGEEIGMLNMPFASPEDLRDIESINFYNEECKKGGDAADQAFMLGVLEEMELSNMRTIIMAILMFGFCLVIMMTNHSYLNRRTKESEMVAKRDPMTGVGSKHAYMIKENDLNSLIHEGEAEPFAVVVCDVNGLKKINDTLGHKAGDEYIRKACTMICDIFRHSPVFRVGGDEFVAVLSGRDFAHKNELMQVLHDRSAEHIQSNDAVVSGGLAVFMPEKDHNVHDVFQRADELMYQEKKVLKSLGAVTRDDESDAAEAAAEAEKAGKLTPSDETILNIRRFVLIADDEETNRIMLGSVLEDQFDILYAADGEETMEIVRERKDDIALVLLDLMMPLLDGREVLKQMSGDPELRMIPVIVLTADQEAELECLKLGAMDFIPKPYPIMEVIRARVNRCTPPSATA